MDSMAGVGQRFADLERVLDEKSRRLLVAAESKACGRGGISAVSKLADETGLAIAVSYFPPGTSKWNKIEHRLFSFISQNWRGQPLTSLKVIVSLIAATTTRKGLKVHAEIDPVPILLV